MIRHATPVAERQQKEEFIWVPGPWRDPALLEWKRGGSFELRIFPIPAHGQRRVVLGYTETLAPFRDGRRYVYPLGLSADASTRVGRFEVDLRVAGADPAFPVVSHGYEMRSSSGGGATRLAYAQDAFLPAGDLIVDFVPPNRGAELRSWTYAGSVAPAVPPPERRRPLGAAVGPRGGGFTPPERGTRAGLGELEGRELLERNDARPYVAIALRPELPPFTETRSRDYVLVIDSSQSMVGERWARASRLAAGIVGEMDRRDRFALLACDATCRYMSDAPRPASPDAALEVTAWLATIRPAGASDVVGALDRAAHLLDGKRADGRDVRVLYLGDGIASVGPRRAASVAAEVESLSRTARVAFSTVAIGGDADALALGAIARAGGGHHVPWVPGERASTVALAVFESASRLLAALPDEESRRRAEAAASEPALVPNVGGDIVVDASWTGGADLDLSIVTPQGSRLSWLGGRTGVSAEAASERGRERLALRRASVGSYAIEVSRTRPEDTTPVSGRVVVQVLGARRTLDFSLSAERVAVGRLAVRRESRLEPAPR